MGALLVAVAVSWLGVADPAQEAMRFLEQCRDGKYDEAAKRFDETVGNLLPADKLKTTWEALIGQLGPLKSMGSAGVEQGGGFTKVRIRCEFDKAPLDAMITFNASGQIAGFAMVPPAADIAKEDPPYADRSKYEEQEVTVGAEAWPLKGTLTRPKGVTSAPLVVLVHGSGPHDQNEAIGPNAPFRDLARGLATRGIAVLRYEKRTHAYGPKLKSLPFDAVTIDTEVIDDALAAIVKGRAMAGIDPKRVYLLGHSLGGSAGPDTAKRDGKLAGLILMAAADRQPDA
ncbi:MAG TPA: alpha/beta fold hydrolase, partial [Isosphaeraceae bacterium]|nr:alpha/beta fold hydrolase [Isosphaeraceae bacterium]